MNKQEKLAYRIDEACAVAALGRTTLYSEIAAGRLEARKAGRRTLITADALSRWLDGLPVLATKLAELSAVPSANVHRRSPTSH
jgi:excisionase family DNA binding protein